MSQQLLKRDIEEKTLEGNILTQRSVHLLSQFLISDEHSIDSYDLFIERAIEMVANTSFVAVRGEKQFYYQFTQPSVSTNYEASELTSSREFLPLKKLSKGTYILSLKTDVRKFEIVGSEEEPEYVEQSPEHLSINIPLMLGSKYDELNYNIEPNMRCVISGQCSLDPLGYFIINGTPNRIVMRDGLRVNKIIVYFDSQLDRVISRFTAETQSGTMVIKATAGSVNKFKLNKSRITQDILNIINQSIEIQTQTTTMAKHSIPFPVFFYLLEPQPEDVSQVDYENGIIERVLSYISAEYQSKVRVLLLNSFVQASAEINKYGSIQKLIYAMCISEKTIKRPDMDEMINQIVNELFPNYSFDELNLKLELLAKMVATLAEHMIGIRGLDNRDDWQNKRTITAGKLLEQLFRRLWQNFINLVQHNIKGGRRVKTISESLTNDLNSIVNQSLISSFTPGRWKVGNSSQAVTDYPKPQGPTEMRAIATKISAPSSTQGTSTSMREVRASQWGFICPVKTPEGKACGTNKYLASTCKITMGYPESYHRLEAVLQQLQGSKYYAEIWNDTFTGHLMVNGKIRGYCNIEYLRRVLTTLRRQNIISYETSLTYDKTTLYIHTDSGRNIRPLLIVNMATGRLVIEEKQLWSVSGAQLIEEGAVEFIDTWEQDMPHVIIAPTLAEFYHSRRQLQETALNIQQLKNKPNYDVQELTKLEKDFKLLIRTKLYSYAELHPASILSITAAMIPLPERNQGPRNVYQSNMADQALAKMTDNMGYKFEKTARYLMYPETPLFGSDIFNFFGFNVNPTGSNVIIAILAMPHNQEDAIILNRQSVDLGLFHNVKVNTIVITLEASEFIGFPKNVHIKAEDYAHIDPETGLPYIGTTIKAGTIVMARYKMGNEGSYKMDPVRAGMSQTGVVEAIYNPSSGGKSQRIMIRIRDYRVPECGDKAAPRCAQKGTFGLVMPPEDMPVLNKLGRAPDLIINPHSLPSRMTLAFILEIVASKVAAIRGEFIHATPWENITMDELYNVLTAYGFRSDGNDTAFDGQTGKTYEVNVFAGVAYYQLLKHMVRDKYQARGGGRNVKYNNLRQPPKGRKMGGGLRFGEMEVSASLAHGASHFIWDRMCGSSDKFKVVICRNCGDIAITNILNFTETNRCLNCELKVGIEPSFLTIEVPYILIYLKRSLQAGGIDVRFNVQTIEEYNQHLLTQQELIRKGVMVVNKTGTQFEVEELEEELEHEAEIEHEDIVLLSDED